MRSILHSETREEIIKRINSLDAGCEHQWGKMTVGQMVKHCTLCEELYLGKVKLKRVFLGRIFGKMALNKLLSDDRPIRKSSPTDPFLRVVENIDDLEAQKQKWIALIKEYETANTQSIHPFFGKMTIEQLGQLAYKHNDHHLRQFGR
ncbi:MAG: DinB family protein [Bacteroidota bacterium]|nr:DinB family protein [Bacteroidota bacterium]